MFIKDTLNYIVKNWRLVLVALVPGVLLGLFASPASLFPLLFSYRAGAFNNLGAALKLIFPFGNHLWLLLIIPVTLVFCSVILGLSEHKMRVGNYGFKEFGQRLNFGITALIIPFAVLASVYFIWMFLSSCILVFIEYICFTLIGSAALSMVMVIIVAIALLLLLIWLASLLLLWPAVSLVSGYGVMDSWYYQLKLVGGNMVRFAFAIALLLFINGAVVTSFSILLGLFLNNMLWLGTAIVNTACFTFSTVYLLGLTMTAYFRLSDTPRKDKKKKYYL